jgi:hypothetical protein
MRDHKLSIGSLAWPTSRGLLDDFEQAGRVQGDFYRRDVAALCQWETVLSQIVRRNALLPMTGAELGRGACGEPAAVFRRVGARS